MDLFALYGARQLPQIHVVSTESEYWDAVSRHSGPRSVFEAQGARHGQIDSRLADAVEGVLVPVLGPWEQSEKWFHNQDFYGDGVRMLMFCERSFPRTCIPMLQDLLNGEAAEFCIAIQLCDSLMGESIETIGAIAITQNDLIITKSLAPTLSGHQ